MSIEVLVARWEEALVRSLDPQERDTIEFSERDLEMVAGVSVRASVRAGETQHFCTIFTCVPVVC